MNKFINITNKFINITNKFINFGKNLFKVYFVNFFKVLIKSKPI